MTSIRSGRTSHEYLTVAAGSSSSAPRLEPVIAGKYELLRTLGEGGFSWVFLARHTRIPQLRLAIKVLKTSSLVDASALARIEREANLTAMLHGDNSVKVVDVGMTEEGYPFLAMDFVRGLPLRDLLKTYGPLPALSVAKLSRDILLTLHEAHQHGLVHRDLKPSNIFIVQAEGRPVSARVIDFGIAGLLDNTELANEAATIDGALACTPQYAAPEVLRGQASPRSDLYALGLIIAEMLDGVATIREENAYIAASRQLASDDLDTGDRARASALAPIIHRALRKQEDERYPDAASMIRDVEAVIQRIEAAGLEDRLDVQTLIERFHRSIDNQKTITSPISLREGVGIARRSSEPTSFSRTGQTFVSTDRHVHLMESTRRAKRASRAVVALVAVLAALVIALVVLLTMQRSGGAPASPLSTSIATAEELSSPLVVNDAIRRDTTWTADRTYVLDGLVFVEGGATLNIEAGTEVRGRQGSALIVTRDGMLYARGTAQSPITFTSARTPAERRAGDWGGLVLLGSAPHNDLLGLIEGVPQHDRRGAYGGNDPNSSCGILEHVRIAHAGYEIFANNEINGLTLGGCGEGTIVRNIHVHETLDDGIEIFGGNVDLRHILVTYPGDDGIDWDQGWTGSMQFAAVLMDERGDNAIEADNSNEDPEALPRSAPTIANLSLLSTQTLDAGDRALVVRNGSAGRFINTMIYGFASDPIDIRGEESAAAVAVGELTFEGFILTAANGEIHFDDETLDNDDGGFDEAAYFEAVQGQRAGFVPQMSLSSPGGLTLPLADAQLASDTRLPETEFFDRSARYIGAFAPGQATTWAEPWALPLEPAR